MDLFLYDYTTTTIEARSELILFGYDQQGRKCEVYLRGFEIDCLLSIDRDFFESGMQLRSIVEALTYTTQGRGKSGQQEKRKLKDLVKTWSLVQGKAFKGLQCASDSGEMLRVQFERFDQYESFKRVIKEFNDQVEQFQNTHTHTHTDSDAAIGGKKQKQAVASKDIPEQASRVFSRFSCQTGLKQMRKAPIRMFEDDAGSKYIYKLQRHHKFQVSGWNRIAAVVPAESKSKRIAYQADIRDIVSIERAEVPLDVLSWDIEVSTESGKFDSNGYNPNNRIVCIGLTIGSVMNMGKSRRQVCIVPKQAWDGPSTGGMIVGENGENIEVIVAADEVRMIQHFAQCIYDEDPAFITGFNDSSFDLPFLKQKLELYSDPDYYLTGRKGANGQISSKYVSEFAGRLQGMRYDAHGRAYSNNASAQGYTYATKPGHLFKSSGVKVTAGNTRNGIGLDIPGIICIDTRTLLMKDQVLERRSLNEYLKANNLPLKLEVSFDDMNRAFKALTDEAEEDDAEALDTLTLNESLELSGMPKRAHQRHVKHLSTLNRIYEYCVYDADACRLLWAKRNLVYQQIEVCRLSFTPLRAGFLNANGIKVRNMVASYAFDRGYAVPMAMTSCDVRLRDKRLLDEYGKYPGAYVPEPHKGVSLSPVIALDFASLYPSIIMAHNLSPECVVEEQDVVSVQPRQEGALYQNVTLRSGQTVQCNSVVVDFESGFNTAQLQAYVLAREEGVGVYPFILQSLFNMRAQVKKVLEGIDEQLKELEHDRQGNARAIQDLLYQYSLVDAKQKAIKVFMNTFYGETGNQQSSLFDVVISGGTTSYGQKYIKQVHKAIGEQDCEVVAGDTDSIYFRPRASHYSLPADATDILDQANQIADRMRLFVNEMIGKQTHGFLKMAFEELLCPSVFTGKKKYFGAMYKPGDRHRDRIDVALRGSVLVKGIDFIKSQYPDLIKRHGYLLINTILNEYNDLLKAGLTPDMLTDRNRHAISQQLLAICSDSAVAYLNDVKALKPEQFHLISSKKRMRDATGGEMAGFRERLQEKAVPTPFDISIKELNDLDIPVPLVGEVLDIVYIQQDAVCQKKFKSAEKMHLLDYAVKKSLKLNFADYLDMFATSIVRISLITRLPPNIEDLDPGAQNMQFDRAQKELKNYFSARNFVQTRKAEILQTIEEIKTTQDLVVINGFVNRSVSYVTGQAHLRLVESKPLIKQLRTLPEECRQLIADELRARAEAIDPDGLLSALFRLRNKKDCLNEVLSDAYDPRYPYITKHLDQAACEALDDACDRISDESKIEYVRLIGLAMLLDNPTKQIPTGSQLQKLV